jgi:hypothetical protein
MAISKARLDRAEAKAQARLEAEMKAAVHALEEWIDTNGTLEEQEAHTRCLLHLGPQPSDSMLAEINLTRAEVESILANTPKPTPEDSALADGLYARIPADLKARVGWRGISLTDDPGMERRR